LVISYGILQWQNSVVERLVLTLVFLTVVSRFVCFPFSFTSQYFIDVAVDDPSVVGVKPIECHFIVDQKDLDYRNTNLPLRGKVVRAGLWNRSQDHHRALAFTLPKINFVHGEQQPQAGGSTAIGSIGSQIIVCIHESIEYIPGESCAAPCPVLENIAASNTENSGRVFRTTQETIKLDVPKEEEKNLKDKKVMRSTAGTATLAKKKPQAPVVPVVKTALAAQKTAPKSEPAKPKKKYCRGPHLATVTLNYCSTVGLILLGVLPKPHPDWKPTNSTVTGPPPPPPVANLDEITETITYKDDFGLEHQAVQFDLTGLSDDNHNETKKKGTDVGE